jgi:hypothetical protein
MLLIIFRHILSLLAQERLRWGSSAFITLGACMPAPAGSEIGAVHMHVVPSTPGCTVTGWRFSCHVPVRACNRSGQLLLNMSTSLTSVLLLAYRAAYPPSCAGLAALIT